MGKALLLQSKEEFVVNVLEWKTGTEVTYRKSEAQNTSLFLSEVHVVTLPISAADKPWG